MRGWVAVVVVVLGCKDAAKTPPAPAPAEPVGAADPWNAAPPPAPVEQLPAKGGHILEARKGFKTRLLVDRNTDRSPPEKPPAPLRLVRYDAPVGKLHAYLTPAPKDGQRHPAIIWLTGGDTSSIGDVWSPQEPENDQSAAQYRAAGVVTMYPSLRGGHDNPGRREGFYGEVDDVLAAAEFLRKQPGVAPDQIYLGGHSTGGTLALLVAAAAPKGRFRAVFAFGPVTSIDDYGSPNEFAPFDMADPRELELRAPKRWLGTIATLTFVIEGGDGNIGALDYLRRVAYDAPITFIEKSTADHFSVLAPANAQIAASIAGAWRTGPVILDL